MLIPYRAGEIVDEAGDLEFDGLNRLCSAQYIAANQFGNGRGLADNMFFTGEESSGGTEFVLDVFTNTLYAVPWMGRAAWESVTELDTGTTDQVAILIGDDREAAPLLMYVGEKNSILGFPMVISLILLTMKIQLPILLVSVVLVIVFLVAG